MSARDEKGKGICILSLDSGGPGTYSQLLIIKEYTSRLANDLGAEEEDVYPADYFDLMGGVGFGGLVAIMLGHLRMNVDEAIEALLAMATGVFTEGSQDVADPETSSKNLKEAVEEMLQIRSVPLSTKMYERDRPQTGCKVVLYAATSNNLSHPQAFRTYSHRGASLNPTIVEAVCATMVIPSLFSPVKIGPRLRQQSFLGGAIGANNPTRELLNEASAVFGKNGRVAQIISIGSGLPRLLSVESPKDEKTGYRLMADIMADCETVARELAARLILSTPIFV